MWSNRSTRTKIALAAGAATAAAVIAGCSSNTSGGHDMSQMSNTTTSASPSSGAVEGVVAFNDADVTFLQTMYPHHAQAVEMAALAEGRTTNQQVLDLAKAVEAAQDPEMEQMSTLLAQWGKPAPTTDAGSGSMSGMGHGNGGMSGMMTNEQMTGLAGKNGAEFDTMWLTMMIDHHTGAVEMAQIELADGTNPDAKQLAEAIIGAQQREITIMNALLQQN